MTFIERAFDQPRSLWVRRAVFQIHLWAGLAVGLWAVMIGVTGSILMFREEIMDFQTQAWQHVPPESAAMDPDVIVKSIRQRYPAGQIYLELPGAADESAKASVFGPKGNAQIFVNPYRGDIIGERDLRAGWMHTIDGLHSNILLGRSGRLWNGIGALALMLMTISGMMIWWPGRRLWKRSVQIDFGARWRRLNWDLHNAVGFWTMAGILLLSFTGTWFTWNQVFRNAVGAVTPVSKPKPVKVQAAEDATRLPIREIIAAADLAAPGRPAWRLNIASARNEPIRVVKRGDGSPAFMTATTIALNPYTAEVLQVDSYGKKTTGDRILSWLGPLHFGNFGGRPIQILWFVLGLVIPGMFITGFVMWWDRVVVRQWRKAGAKANYLDFISEPKSAQ